MSLDVKSFAVTCGLLWGFGLFFITWWIIAFEGVTGEITMIGRVYRGFSISPMGSVAGLIWGLVDGAVGGAIFALVYNAIASRRKTAT